MIEPIKQEDLKQVINYRVKLFKDAGKIHTRTEEEEMLACNRKYFKHLMEQNRLVGFVERNNGEIVSIALAVILEFPPVCIDNKGIYGHIFNVYTESAYRNKGKAYHILEALIQELWRHSVDKIILDANEKSVSLYQKFGFCIQDKSMVLNSKV